jgi:hypothetical protein
MRSEAMVWTLPQLASASDVRCMTAFEVDEGEGNERFYVGGSIYAR